MTAELVGGAGLPPKVRVVVGGASVGVATSSITMSVMEKEDRSVLKGGEDDLFGFVATF